VLIANSTYTRERIRSYYKRDAQVIAPPIETSRFERAAAGVCPAGGGAPFLLVSALVPNKRVDLALRAFEGRRERLLVVGEGPERARLEPLVGPNVTLLSRIDDAKLAALYSGCRALIHTGVDDIGMVMVEALASGKPVIACAEGGALDIVRDGETGLLVEEPTVASVRAALDRFERMRTTFDPGKLQGFARSFDRAHFERRFVQAVEVARRAQRDVHANGTHNGNGRSHSFVHRVEAASARQVSTVDPAPTPAPRDGSLTPRRVVDVILAASGLVVTAPLLATLAALIPLDSRGSVLFFQRRTGLGQRPFTLIKLRTMDAEGRVTRMGRLLRPTGIDELPQLWNVLKGDMSLIGPRPEVFERVERHEWEIPGFGARHQIRPGITGWAQVNGLRGDVSIAERLRFDLEYVRGRCLALDGRILLRTVSTVMGDTLRELRGVERVDGDRSKLARDGGPEDRGAREGSGRVSARP
jgi:lipopolysaccharide/colanic/teichoic acid biosynthesis glycosyltransferase